MFLHHAKVYLGLSISYLGTEKDLEGYPVKGSIPEEWSGRRW